MRVGCCVLALHLVVNIAGAVPFARPAAAPADAGPVENCTNFAGNYHGTCVVDGKKITKSSHVEQSGCETLTVDGDNFKIGAVVSKTFSDPSTVEAARFNWDKDKKSLLFTGVWIGGAGDALSLRGTVTLDGGKLHEVLNVTGPTAKTLGTCVLTKQ